MSGFKNFQRKLDGLPPVDKTQRLGLEFVSSPFEPLEWSDYDDEDDDFDPDMDFEVGWDEDAELYSAQEPDNQLTGSNQTSVQQGQAQGYLINTWTTLSTINWPSTYFNSLSTNSETDETQSW